MADSAYYHLERMLPELDDLKERGLFSVAEIREIARQRREFEFRLERRSKVKEDYLRYIDYEKKLEKLRRIRKKAIVRELQDASSEKKKGWQPSLCDRASAMRIMLIYERAVTRFKGDLGLWLQFIQYCRSQGTRRMQKVLTKALRLHPAVPGLWIYSAAWEFEHNGDIAAARALMQRGLRMCPNSEKLWLEYFRMELVYTEKMRERLLNHLMEKRTLNVKENGDNEEHDDDNILRLQDDSKELDDENMSVLTVEETQMEISTVDELAYKLSCTVYRNAISAIPTNLSFRKSFMSLLQKASFSQKSALQNEVLDSLKKDFPMDAECWDWQARHQFETTGEKDEAIKVYENALEVASSIIMYEVYAQFLKELSGVERSKYKTANVRQNHSEEERYEAATLLLQLYSRAKEANVFSPCLAEGHVNVLLNLGKLDTARQVLEELCSGNFRTCARLWTMRIVLEMKRETRAELPGLNRLADLCESCLKQIPMSEAQDIWAMVLEYFGEKMIYDRIIDMMISKIASASGDSACPKLACSLIDWVLYTQDIKQARKIYSSILDFPAPNFELYKHCITIESRIAEMGCKEAEKCVRSLFQSAVDKYSQDTDLWLAYYSHEIKSGNLDIAGNIYWRAKKILQDPSSFIEGHQHLVSQGDL